MESEIELVERLLGPSEPSDSYNDWNDTVQDPVQSSSAKSCLH
jgi:hypothetical protein